MTITPQGKVYLCKTKLQNDYKNQLTFTNKQEQTNYFNSTIQKTFSNYTYIKKDNTIAVDCPIDEIIDCNYLFYNNGGFTNKIYYCFITNMTYENEDCTIITFETDRFQTWYFDIIYNRCFVSREHVNSDEIGEHTIPENLETGDYISCTLQPTLSGELETCFCVASSEPIFSTYSTSNQVLPTGLYYYGVTTLQGIKDIIEMLDSAGVGDAINSIFVIPKGFFYNWQTNPDIDGQVSASVRFSINPVEINVTHVDYLGNDYIPKNKKLLTSPYSFLQVSNHNGSVINYEWENFNLILKQGVYKFKLGGVLTPGGSFQAYPIDYKNILNNYDEAITLGKFPIGGWNTDVYTNWLTQNGLNIAVDITQSTISAGASLLSGNIGGSVSSALNIAHELANIYQHSMIPNQARGNTNVGDYSFANGLTNLEFKRISIKNEYAEIIDNYFSMFGYKVNSVKVPNITGRSNWNYVKTIECNFTGNIPQEDLKIIRTMFDNGVTLWHSPNNMFNYGLDNNIV